jgi:hypothetical protein
VLRRRPLGGDRLDKRLTSIDDRLAALEEKLGGRGVLGQLRHLELELQAIQRHMRVVSLDPEAPYNLMAGRFRGRSQNEEDGITLGIFERAGVTTRRFVELGCGRNGGNSGFLAAELGWSGLMVDAQDDLVAEASALNPATIVGVAAWLTRDSVNSLIEQHGFGGEIDLLSIDVDGNDYWIWEALTVCSPRLVIAEYNSIFGPQRSVVVPYSDNFDRHEHKGLQRVYYGASLQAFAALAKQKGYRLVAVEPRGVNAFWLRDDVANELPAQPARSLYRLLDKHRAQLERLGDVFAELERRGLPLVEVTA